MFEDFDARNNTKQEDDEDSETLSYSYPSYSRFTYTGKTKSRLGRSRFMRQTGGKEESKKTDDSSCGASDSKSNHNFLQSNSQAPKTPGVSWLQREPTHPFTPGGKSNNVEVNSFQSQSNFLFNLKNDQVQNSNCKRNLPFSTTPFKSKEVPKEKHNICNPLKELNQLLKPQNPFSSLDFFGRSKNENKENSGAPISKSENLKNGDLDPSWNKLKNICDSAISYPALPTSIADTNKGVNTGDQCDFGKTNEPSRPSIFTSCARDEKKKDDDSSNMPLDLSSAESTSRSLFNRSVMSGCDQIDSDTSSSLNRQSKDMAGESMGKAEDSTLPRTNTDALSSFLPKFLAPKNKNNLTDSTENDVSAHSIGTVVERIFDFQPQPPFLKPQNIVVKTQLTSCDTGTNGNEVNSSAQHKPAFHYDVKKSSPPSLPINFIYKEPNSSGSSQTKIEVQSSHQLELCQATNKKSSPPSVPGNLCSMEAQKISPPSAHSIPGSRNLENDGQQLLKQQHDYVDNNLPIINGRREINSLAQHFDTKLDIVSKSSTDDQIANDKYVGQLKNATPLMSSNEIAIVNQYKSDVKPVENVINHLVSNQQKIISGNHAQRSNEQLLSHPLPVGQHQVRPQAAVEAGENNLNQMSLQQVSALPKPAVINQRDPVMYPRPSENIQASHLSQKTYLAPQQPLDRNAGDFPHVKPEVPQQVNNKPSFSGMKKPNQFKMSAPRGMPSRADTELSVNGKSYAILSMLGKGGSSEVYQVLDSTTSKLLAVKCVDLSMVDKTIADGYLNEIDLLSRLQGCASVIRMFDYEYVQECKMLYVVMEKGDTDLSHLIRDISKTKKISMSMIIYYWTEMLQAVKDIHDQGIIHSDLKPANFLLVSGRLKLIDFGIASSQGDMTSVVKEVTTGTWNYMSPEAIKNTSASGKGFKITYKSDVWSLGCILYNLVYGKTPFSHITNTWGKLSAIADPNHCIEFPDVGAPAVLVKALRSCFHREPKLRPTVAELLSLPYHSTSAGGDLAGVGRQVQAILPTQWWLRVAHLFPEVKTNQEGKNTDNAG